LLFSIPLQACAAGDGVSESWGCGETWLRVSNLPGTQFYRATPDNDLPF
jgi:hypothetical protein